MVKKFSEEECVSGFVYSPRGNRFKGDSLLIPSGVASALEAEERSASEAEQSADPEPEKPKPVDVAGAARKLAKRRTATGREIQVFDVAALERRIEAKKKNSDFSQQVALMKLASDNAGRRVVPKFSVTRLLDGLADEFPNFRQAIEGMASGLAFAAAARPRDFLVRPVVLDGAPGIGKTRFARRLAERLGVPLINMSSGALQTSADLTGSSTMWGNSQPGQVFRTLAESESATAILLLDELDKVRGSEQWNPVPALLQVLEPESARVLKDASVEVEFDASKLIVIGTSNRFHDIDPTLRTRLAKFDIAEPDEAQRIAVAVRACGEMARTVRKKLALDMKAAGRLAQDGALTLRDIIGAVRNGVGNALASGKGEVTPLVEERDRKQSRGIGFLAKF